MLKNSGGKTGFYFLLIFIGVLIGIFVGGEAIRRIYLKNIGFGMLGPDRSESVSDTASGYGAKNRNISGAEYHENITASRRNAIVNATEKVAPCVVGIVVTQIQIERYYYYEDFFDLFLTPKLVPKYKEIENMGSGVVIGNDGLILTNNHVVEGAQKLYVNFSDGQQFSGRIVGRDPYSDLAVVSVGRNVLKKVRFGDSEKLMLGEWVIAIGNPFLNFFNDPNPTVTVGVVSALDRNFMPFEDVYYQGMIQTDAAINPGNSGGPLVNSNGEVIGINAFIFTGSKKYMGSIGIGFAIPINRARRVVDELVKYGRRREIWTGILVQDLDRSVSLALGYDRLEGVLVTDVQSGSSGAAAGIQNGDIIVEMGDRIIRSHADLDGFFLNYFVGDEVSVAVVRKRQKVKIKLLLKEYPRGS